MQFCPEFFLPLLLFFNGLQYPLPPTSPFSVQDFVMSSPFCVVFGPQMNTAAPRCRGYGDMHCLARDLRRTPHMKEYDLWCAHVVVLDASSNGHNV